jgi:uncharacterized membrane protein
VPGEPGVGRIESVSDGVFAVAITLLALDLRVPDPLAVHGGTALLDRLGEQWPVYAAFVLSFVLIAEVWINHRRLFACLGRASHGLLWSNAFLLLSVITIPFATSLLGQYVTGHGASGRRVAAVAYGATWAFGGLAFNLTWWQARHHSLLRADLPADTVLRLTHRWVLGPIFYTVSAVVALIAPWVSLLGLAVLGVLFVLPPPGPPPR